jgi:hypothetical protein
MAVPVVQIVGDEDSVRGARGPRRGSLRVLPTLAVGLLGGLALGVVARAWMRLIAEQPEFSWNGTVFIIAGFAIFGVAQASVALARQRARGRWTLSVVRMAGAIAMLPLFGGAGALMFPTVIGGGLAVARDDWHTATRGICLVVAAGPVLFVGSDLVGTFGWSLQSVAGFVVMLAIYSTIIGAARSTLAPPPNGRRLRRRTVAAIALVVGLLFVVPLCVGGIQ